VPRSDSVKYRLKRRNLIERLFATGSQSRKSVAKGSVAIKYDFVDLEIAKTDVAYQAGVTANRRIRRAVDRNRVKRILRLAISQNHQALMQLKLPSNKLLIFMMIFRGHAKELDCSESAQLAIQQMVDQLTP
jgi:ribonuclease P protein component